MTRHRDATDLKPTTTKVASPPISKGATRIARAAGLLPDVEASRGRGQADDDELLLAIARLMRLPAPPKSVSAAIEMVLDSSIWERKGPKKDWVVRLDGKWILYKGVEQRLRDGYEKDTAKLQERLASLEAFQARMERRVAAIAEPKAGLRLSGARLSSKKLEQLRAWNGDLLLMQDLDRCGDVVRSVVDSAVKKRSRQSGKK